MIDIYNMEQGQRKGCLLVSYTEDFKTHIEFLTLPLLTYCNILNKGQINSSSLIIAAYSYILNGEK